MHLIIEKWPEASTEDMFIVDGEVDRKLALESYLSSGILVDCLWSYI